MKRVFKAFLITVILFIFPAGANAMDIIIGDANGDGRITSADATMIARYLAGHVNVNPVAADVNCDGEVNLADVSALARFLVGHFDTPCLQGGCENCEPPLYAEDFILTVTVEAEASPLGEIFVANAELKNNSGECVVIYH